MHETTQISYGEGTVSVVFNSESLSEVSAPYFRAGDYEDVLTACFTKKELEKIYGGDLAEVTFNFVMSDEISDAQLLAQFDATIADAEKTLGTLYRGVCFDASSYKVFNSDTEVTVESLDHDFELQIEIPLYLRKDNREYYIIINNMGVCRLYEDIDEEADTLSIAADSLGSYLMVYREGVSETQAETSSKLTLRPQHLFFAAIIALLALWFAVGRLHRKE